MTDFTNLKNQVIGLPKRVKYFILVIILFIVLNIVLFENQSSLPSSKQIKEIYKITNDHDNEEEPFGANPHKEGMESVTVGYQGTGAADSTKTSVGKPSSGAHVENSIQQIESRLTSYSTFKKFLTDYFKIIELAKPKILGINNGEHYRNNERVPVYGGHLRENYKEEPVRNKYYLSSFLQLSAEEVSALKDSHNYITSHLPSSFPDSLFAGNGIVYVGGGKYDWLVLLSIKSLRDLGSVLPVEIIIPNDNDFNIDLCNRVFPILNAKCLLMSDYLPSHIKIDGFQLKAFALIISSFEKILYLDSDNIVIKNPDLLFNSEPFLSSKLVSWPDFWRRSTSPLYYEISGIYVDESKHLRNSYQDNRDKNDDLSRLSYHDFEGTLPESTSETGQLVIDKTYHTKTLMLALYYNVYGPDYFYPLFSQGAAGEGDKETFVAAAHRLNESYYQVTEFIREFGSINADTGKHEILGMGQYDPTIDYAQLINNETSDDYSAENSNNYHYHYFKHSELMFLHANWPKLHPIELSDGTGLRKVVDDEGKRHRLYSDEIKSELGYDLELRIWENMKWFVCDMNGIKFFNLDSTRACGEVKKQINFLKKH